ncbi:MAG: signal peptidase I [Pyrinomonadaceae bacterium]|nr:signal peptidase I [Pyrinomonadaceae bacterium]
MRKNTNGTLLLFLFCFVAVACGRGLVKVPTEAMHPTIPVGSYVEWTVGNEDINRFDLVLHTLPLDEHRKRIGENEDTKYIFRVVALGGETIEMKNGRLYINGRKIEEPFETVSSDESFGRVEIPEGEYFLLGDNRPQSADSRYWKPPTVRKERIIGKVVRIF